MIVTQVNIFRCERCRCVKSISRECQPYDETMVRPPEGWDYDKKRYDPEALFSCPRCIKSKKAVQNKVAAPP